MNTKEIYYKSIGGLYGSSPFYFINKCTEDYNSIIIVVNNNNEIHNLSEELKLFVDSKIIINKFFNYENLPYDEVLEDKDLLSSRIQTIYNINNSENNITITNTHSLIRNLSSYLLDDNFFKIINKDFKYQDIIKILEKYKYEKTSLVINKGEFATKGPIIDIFPTNSVAPFRINFDEGNIENIKSFDITSQITSKSTDKIILSANTEIILDNEDIAYYKKSAKEIFDDGYVNDIEYEKIINNIHYPNAHNILPIIYKKSKPLIDCFSNNCLLVSNLDLSDEITKTFNNYQKYYEANNAFKYILKPNQILATPNKLSSILNCLNIIKISSFRQSVSNLSRNETIKKLPLVLIDNKYPNPFRNIIKFIENDLYKIYIFITRESLRKELTNALSENSMHFDTIDSIGLDKNKQKISIINGNITEGFIDFSNKVAFISSTDIFGKRANYQNQINKKRKSIDEYYNDISEIEVGQYIVHEDHGVGIYKGMMNMNIEEVKTEMIKLEYANEDILYIPVTSIDLIKKFNNSSGLVVKLNDLGDSKWQRIKKKAKNKINDLAVEILEMEAKRNLREGFAFNIDPQGYTEFKNEFPFNETVDQIKTIREVEGDMSSKKPMDRIICGDVGFGKTEIIMRASYLAAMSNKQSLLLAPTTILVEQHYKSFKKRFLNTPINIAKLSRLESQKSKNSIINSLKDGSIDILIGTHATLSNEISFNDLGFLIIDEEHKFGVRAKEKIKNFKGLIDVISMTATPIPRTLNSALSQMKDLSLLESPPENRKSIITEIIEWNDDIIVDAINREIQRGGQIYFVHNDIKSIPAMKEYIGKILQDVRIGIIHAKLENKVIEEQMNKFINKEYDLIICTSIIESGLDIANVNTIFINDSDRFGLSQLHQIRGRVGRSSSQAYAYFLIKNKHKINTISKNRLEAIDSINSLGGGLEIATRDLEIRGAGEILGQEQSGQMYEIGYAMFTDLLKKTINFLKMGKEIDEHSLIIDINKSCLIPDNYVEDVYQRLKYYQKISQCKSQNQIDQIRDEFIDIFGPIPEFLENLLVIRNLKNTISNIPLRYLKIVNDNVFAEFISKEACINYVINNHEISSANKSNNSIKFKISNKDNFVEQCNEIERKLSQ